MVWTRAFSCLLSWVLLSCLPFLSACTLEIEMPKNDEGLRQEAPAGRLRAWAQSAIINPDGTNVPVPQGQSSFSLQCKLDAPSVFTVEFEIGPSLDPAIPLPINKPTAEIEWTVNGNTVRRVVSVVNGTSISGTAEFVKVKFFESESGASTAPYAATAMVSPGVRAAVVQPTNQSTDSVALDAAGMAGPGEVFIDVPQDKGIVTFRVFAWDEAETGALDMTKILVLQQTSANNTISGFQDPNEAKFVHLNPSVTVIKVVNLGSVGARVFIVWGVDG